MKLGVVTGMLAEARLLDGIDCLVTSGGGDAESTRAGIAHLLEQGATHLISFGIAGALDRDLLPGDLILASGITLPDGRVIAADAAWLRHLSHAFPAARPGLIAGSSNAAASSAAKAALQQATGALAVDMESHHAALIAAERGLPFAALRVIADTASDNLPAAALVGLDKKGRPAIGAVLWSLLKAPWQLPALIRLARRSNAALSALRAALLGRRAGLL
jgi:hopanoid-associated phosphorylase